MLENGKSMPSVDAWLREAKADVSAADCGMYLTHNGVVRATPKAEARGVETDGVAPGHKVGGMVFGFDAEKVQAAIEATRTMPGIGYVRVWLASGELTVGDDIMLVLIGGDIRPHVVDALQSLTHSFLMVPTSDCSASTTCGRMSPPMSTSMMSSPTVSSPLASHTRT